MIVKDRQLDPVRDEIIHIDLLEVRLDEKIQTQVGVHIEGVDEAPGVKEGGVLEQVEPPAQHRGAADGDPGRTSSST